MRRYAFQKIRYLSNKMIRFLIVVIVAISADNFASPVSSFTVDRHLLHKLKRIEGYKRLYEIDVFATKGRPVRHAVKDYFLYHQADLQVWDLKRADFRVQVFERPCSQLDQLYRKGKSYFDALPREDIDPDKGLLCKVSKILKQCETYLAGDFIEGVYEQIVKHHDANGEGIIGQWVRASFGGESSSHRRKVNSSRTRIRRPGWGRQEPSGYEFR